MKLEDKIISRAEISRVCAQRRARGERLVFTNGCFDILHAGHVALLHEARSFGDYLIVGLNSDASVQRLKGASRPVHDEAARAVVLAALGDVDAVCIFEEDTPEALIAEVRPHVHVKGGDYQPDDLPEAAVVRQHGGEIKIVPLRAGFSTTGALDKLKQRGQATAARAILIIPARYGSTRFPGKPIVRLGDRTVIEHVVGAGLQSKADRPVCVATDDERIEDVIRGSFQTPREVEVIMTSPACHTGTDRLAEAVRARFGDETRSGRLVVINVQGDEPFINPQHINLLIEAMQTDATLDMATLATPIREAAQVSDPNVVKVVTDHAGQALYFSRLPIPFERLDAGAAAGVERLRHIGIYAYSAVWLLRMADLPPTPLEQAEKLEQLRALENGVAIKVLTVDDVVHIAIDTPQDLERAEQFLLDAAGAKINRDPPDAGRKA